MKTKEVIRQLMEADPTGEEEVCVENCDIHFIDVEPAYWDGSLQVLERDETCEYYNIVGAKYVRTGKKIVINTLSISDALLNDPHMPVKVEGGSEESEKRYLDHVEKTRKEVLEMKENVARSCFVAYMIKRLVNFSEDFSQQEVTQAATEFFNQNLSEDDPMPEDILKEWNKSWAERRHRQWDREIQVTFEDKKLVLRKAS